MMQAAHVVQVRGVRRGVPKQVHKSKLGRIKQEGSVAVRVLASQECGDVVGRHLVGQSLDEVRAVEGDLGSRPVGIITTYYSVY